MESAAVKRRLTCILAADAVGYSRHMATNEEGTIKVLAAHRAVIDGIIAFHDGRIVGTAGDSVLAEFTSPVNAVRCASEIQEALKTRNDALPEDQRLLFRVGVNLGDVVVKDQDLLGDGVNIAARLETLAEPGGGAQPCAVELDGKVVKGWFRAERGTGQGANTLTLEGPIEPDGRARLSAVGTTGDPRYTVNQAPAGTPYRYQVDARFEGSAGSGQRLGNRACELRFSKR